MHLLRGSPEGRPTTESVTRDLAEMGLAVTGLREAPRANPWGRSSSLLPANLDIEALKGTQTEAGAFLAVAGRPKGGVHDRVTCVQCRHTISDATK